MKWKTKVAAAVMLALTASGAQAAIPVIDAAAIAQFVEQLAHMKAQLDQARRQYQAISGNRGLGAIHNNPALRESIPQDWQNIYSGDGADGHAIGGQVQSIQDDEALSNESVTVHQERIEERYRRAAATNKALGMKALDSTADRLDQLDLLTQEISATQDPKAIQELQARIAVEQASVQVDLARLQAMVQLQAAEQELIQQQEHAAFKRVINPANTGMPQLR